ncbi:TPA: hypothetical protein EYP70_03030 [Candidatus Bathyarchaeota archaeon]|nr:hypothetical protein [Candidatus Bathyarchaeota archaeon]
MLHTNSRGILIRHSSYIMTIIVILLVSFFLWIDVVAIHVRSLPQNLEVYVNRVVQINDGGSIIINDTITLKGKLGGVTGLSSFSICIPISLQKNLARIFVFDSQSNYKIEQDISIRRADLKCFKIIFPSDVNIGEGEIYTFKVIYVLSNLISAITSNTLHLDLPKYPVLPVPVKHYNLTVILPPEASGPKSPLNFTESTVNGRIILSYQTKALEAFTKDSTWIDFNVTGFTLINVAELTRKISINEWGSIQVEDHYYIVNLSPSSLSKLSFRMPRNATSISVQDIYGSLTMEVNRDEEHVEVSVQLRSSLLEGKGAKILLTYNLPHDLYLKRETVESYILNLSSLTYNNWWIVRKLNVIIVLPEGAEFLSFSGTPSTLEKDILQETLTFTRRNATSFDFSNLNVRYKYGVLWVSFRPTIWSMLLVSILSTFLYWRRQPKPSLPVIPIPVDVLKEFIKTYEEKRRILQGIESIERQVRKGKISRRRYKVQKGSFERRLSRLQKSLNLLRKEIEATSARYAELMKDLEVAEADLETVKASIDRLRIRYRRREISVDTYNRLLDEYERRREKAESTIDEVILRLEEDTR